MTAVPAAAHERITAALNESLNMSPHCCLSYEGIRDRFMVEYTAWVKACRAEKKKWLVIRQLYEKFDKIGAELDDHLKTCEQCASIRKDNPDYFDMSLPKKHPAAEAARR